MEKVCIQCNTTKDVSEFYKKKISKDGLQPRCKACSKINNKLFREKNPDYYWGPNGYFTNRYEETLAYCKKKSNANKSTKIYKIDTGYGIFIGITKRDMIYQLTDMLQNYRAYQDGTFNFQPHLHKVFDKFTYDQVKELIYTAVIIEESDCDRKEGFNKVRKIVNDLRAQGVKVLNGFYKS